MKGTPEGNARGMLMAGALVAVAVMVVVVAPAVWSDMQRPRVDHRTSVLDAKVWCAETNAKMAKSTGGLGRLSAYGLGGKLSHLYLDVEPLVTADEAKHLGDIAGVAFYKQFPDHPVLVTVVVRQLPALREVASVTVTRPAG